ncbi:transposase [Halocynthiibacter sp.]|uniref:transposase n=1 Tax=Halocynthiibacter sp. TaxID=1979210 RepID=UPI003C6A66AE
MNKRLGKESPKHSDDFRRRLVAESLLAGVTVPQVAKRHGVPSSQIYKWRGDDRYAPSSSTAEGFTGIAISDAAPAITLTDSINITLENGRALSFNGCTNTAFILELARGLAR